jgi:hypothetical protein
MHSDVWLGDLKDWLFSAPSFNDLATWLIFVTFYDVAAGREKVYQFPVLFRALCSLKTAHSDCTENFNRLK